MLHTATCSVRSTSQLLWVLFRIVCWNTLWVTLLAFATDRPLLAQDTPTHPRVAPPFAEMVREIEEYGSVALIVQFALPGQEAGIASAGVVDEAAIANGQQTILARLPTRALQNVKVYQYTPHLAVTINHVEALARLYEDPSVLVIEQDIPIPPTLASSTTVMGANFAQILFYTGSGQTVAILDTGIAKNHPALAGKIITESCYSTSNDLGASSLCPNGDANSTKVNSALDCPATVATCDHGTHVAGIIARVAPGVSIISIQVTSRFDDSASNTRCADSGRTSPCAVSYTSDMLAGLNRVLQLHNTTVLKIASVNISLAGGEYSGNCDTDSRKATIDLLRTAGIATVIGAGNNGFRNAMGGPACISTAISVAATNDSDQVTDFSNLSTVTTLFAPGLDIVSSVPSNLTESKNGTSMSAPHVAASVAVLKSINPALSVTEIRDAMINTGAFVTDQRTGGIHSKRRINVYNALCSLISCDSDDYRNVLSNGTITGSIFPANDRDHYFYQATSGTLLSIQMNRTSSALDPYLELYNPQGVRIALNNNGGTENNAWINSILLATSGRYMIVARGNNANTGNYQLITSATFGALPPVPSISYLTPSSLTGNLFASDFWLAINGINFMPTSAVRLNGSPRSMYYSSSNLIYLRVLGSDLGQPWPRTATVTVINTSPSGTRAASRAIDINAPTLGESNLLQPASGVTVATGISTTFVVSWTAPITATTWRSMQNMDLRLRDENNRVAAWIRVTEHVTETSTMRLLNSAEAILSSETLTHVVAGIPGLDTFDITLTDTVTLHLGVSDFSGSGLTAIMSPTVTFGPNAIGRYNVEFRVDGPNGEVQDDDILGDVYIVPATCPAAVTEATLSGPGEGTTGNDYLYTLDLSPLSATQPVTITWAPEPQNGQGTTSALYRWDEAGIQSVFVSVQNCGGFAGDDVQTAISTGSAPHLAISKAGPVSALDGEVITYTLTITNRGSTTATNVVVTDLLPAGVTYVAGGLAEGKHVTFTLPSLAGYASTATFDLRVQVMGATQFITNSVYGVRADGGYSATGTLPVVTILADAQVALGALMTGTLTYPPTLLAAGIAEVTPAVQSSLAGISATFPLGSVFGDTIIALLLDENAPIAAPNGQSVVGSFHMVGFQEGQPLANGFVMGEVVPLTISYSDSSLAGLQEDTLSLLVRNGTQWSSQDIACTINSSANQVQCTLDSAALTDYALVAAPIVDNPDPDPDTVELYLPKLRR